MGFTYRKSIELVSKYTWYMASCSRVEISSVSRTLNTKYVGRQSMGEMMNGKMMASLECASRKLAQLPFGCLWIRDGNSLLHKKERRRRSHIAAVLFTIEAPVKQGLVGSR